MYDLDGAQFVRIDGGWFRTEVRSELGGGRYLMAPGGRVRSDLLLARVDGVWKVTQRPRGGLRGGAPGTQDTSDLAVLNGVTAEKIEGFAIDAAGTGYVVTDNDGVDDSSGETLFWSIGSMQ